MGEGQKALASFLCLSILLISSIIPFEQMYRKDLQRSFCTHRANLHPSSQRPCYVAECRQSAPSYLPVWGLGAVL